jgi:23S rRNA (cytidine1920-2'-O)/16S rRNA (cytidine1409-2'-O)-methyltransferase
MLGPTPVRQLKGPSEGRRVELSRRRLDTELVRRKLVESRASARRAIAERRVRVGDVAEPKAATLVDRATPIDLIQTEPAYVSRGGVKLAGAVEQLAIPIAGRKALDAGASTGGFTDYLLQHGASEVTALDVGYGQLHWRLRGDPRVTVVERTNLRLVNPTELGAPFDLVVVDLSFISLRVVAGVLASVGHEGTDYVLLVKPQFELGPERVGKRGVVRDPGAHAMAIDGVVEALAEVGLGTQAVVASPITGEKGNREFFLWARPGRRRLDEDQIAEAVEA